jgi:hypothetical protein
VVARLHRICRETAQTIRECFGSRELQEIDALPCQVRSAGMEAFCKMHCDTRSIFAAVLAQE